MLCNFVDARRVTKLGIWAKKISKFLAGFFILLASNLASSSALTKQVFVDGRSGPWVSSVNPTFQYGDGTQLAPTSVSANSGLSFAAGQVLTIQYVSGCANFGWACVNGNGQLYGTDNTEVVGMPGYYIPGTQYLEQLLGTFADANGVIVGQPFAIGNGPYNATIPVGATQLLLGFNDGGNADNGAGMNVNVTGQAPTTPGAPTGVSAVGGNASAVVSFTAPTNNGGSAITSYTVTSSPGGLTASASASPITVTGLTNGTAYTFTVKATNSVGSGLASSASNSVTLSTPRALSVFVDGRSGPWVSSVNPTFQYGDGTQLAPTSVSANSGLSFAAGQVLTIQYVSGCANFGWACVNGNGQLYGTDNTEVVGMPGYYIPGTQYLEQLLGTFADANDVIVGQPFAIGNGPYNATIPVGATQLLLGFNDGGNADNGAGINVNVTGQVTGQPTTPIPPVAVAGDASAVLSFTAPTGSNFTSYTVKSNPGNLTATGSSSPITISGLSNATSYTFTLSGTNSLGTSAYSLASNSVTPVAQATVPGAPTGVSAVGGNASAVVSFTAPTNNGGSAITSYTVTSSPGGLTASASASPITVTGLTNGTAYTFTVKATNAAGTSASSAASNVVVPLAPTTTTTTTTSTTTTSSTTTTTTTANSSNVSLTKGWNLIGAGGTQSFKVSTLFGDKNAFITVWKWIADQGQWALYAPSMSATALSDYALGKGYQVLDTIQGSDGFWVNASSATTVALPFGTAYTAVNHRASLGTGWNLISSGDNLTPVRFNNYLTIYSGTMPPSIGSETTTTVYQDNLTSLWAWDATSSKWYFYAPSLDRSQVLGDYISGKGYLNFTTENKKLGSGTGFWVNIPTK